MTKLTAELHFVIIGDRISAIPVLFRASYQSLILKKTKLTCRNFTAPTSRYLCKPPVGNVGEIKRITRDESHLSQKNGLSTKPESAMFSSLYDLSTVSLATGLFGAMVPNLRWTR